MKHSKVCSYAIAVMLSLLFLSSCDKKKLSIQQDFPFEATVLPVPGEIARGQRVEMRFEIKSKGSFDGAKYSVRYFQFEGAGTLQLGNEPALKPNDVYALPGPVFRLYYTSKSNVAHSFDVWITDQFNKEQHFSFQFNPAEGSGGVPGTTGPSRVDVPSKDL